MKKNVFTILHKTLIMSIILSVVLLNSLIEPIYASTNFSDLTASHWAYNNIMILARRGIVNGYEDGTFRPEDPVTRGEFFKLIATTLTSEANIKKQFNYGKNDGLHWATSYYMYLSVNGILMSDPIDNNIDSYITRVEMAAVLSNAAEKVKMKKTVNLNSVIINDFREIDDEHKIYVANAISLGLLKGHDDNTFRAYTNMTRAEAATVICRFLGNK